MLTLGRFTKQNQFLEYFKQSLRMRRTRFLGQVHVSAPQTGANSSD
jgi:hypothetical protein